MQSNGIAALEGFAKDLLAPGEAFIRIVRPALYKNQLVEIDGNRVLLRGAAEVRNATEIAVGLSETKLLADIADGKPLDKTDLLRLYDEYTDKIQRYAHELDEKLNLREHRSAFEALDAVQQSQVLLQVLALLNAKTNAIDLTGIGESAHAGRLIYTFSKLLNSGRFVVIDQSITGMFENRVALKHAEG